MVSRPLSVLRLCSAPCFLIVPSQAPWSHDRHCFLLPAPQPAYASCGSAWNGVVALYERDEHSVALRHLRPLDVTLLTCHDLLKRSVFVTTL